MDARARRGFGKSDPLDAHRIAAAVLPLEEEQLRRPRLNEGVRAALRVLVTARDSMTTDRTRTVNALTALLRINDLGFDARKSLTGTQILEVSRWRVREEPLALSVARSEASDWPSASATLTLRSKQTAPGSPNWLRSAKPRRCCRNPASDQSRPHLPYRLVPSGPGTFRGGFRLPGRGQPHSRFIWKYRPSQAQPRRRQDPEQSPSHGRSDADGVRSSDHRIRSETASRRANQERNSSVREALPRPTDLPHTQCQQSPAIATLTTIEGSPRCLLEFLGMQKRPGPGGPGLSGVHCSWLVAERLLGVA